MPLEDGMMWRQHSTKNVSMAYIENKLNGDTLIAGKIYKKVNWNFIQDPSSLSYWLFGGIQYKAIREDTINKKVFAYYAGDSLMYDFSLQVGDTIHSSALAIFRNAGVDTIRVDNIDSILINGVYHKRFNSTPTMVPGNFPQVYHYIEGIGSTEGFISNNMVFEGEEYLICVGKIFNQSLFPDSTYNCIFATSLNDIQTENHLRIYPNPASDFLRIHSTVSMMKIEFIDMFGHVVYNKSTKSKDAMVSIEQLLNGIYSARILQSDGQVLVRKFLKE